MRRLVVEGPLTSRHVCVILKTQHRDVSFRNQLTPKRYNGTHLSIRNTSVLIVFRIHLESRQRLHSADIPTCTVLYRLSFLENCWYVAEIIARIQNCTSTSKEVHLVPRRHGTHYFLTGILPSLRSKFPMFSIHALLAIRMESNLFVNSTSHRRLLSIRVTSSTQKHH